METQTKQTTPSPSPYQAYLIRCWREEAETGKSVWRFRLQNVQTGEQIGFASLSALLAFFIAHHFGT